MMPLPQFLQRSEVAALLRENHASTEEGAQEFIGLELPQRDAISGGKAAGLLTEVLVKHRVALSLFGVRFGIFEIPFRFTPHLRV